MNKNSADFGGIRDLILHYIEIDDQEWEKCKSMFILRRIKKKEIILSKGEVCRGIYFVVRGLLRIYFIDQNDDEKTFHFSLENTFATDYQSFLKGIPADFYIQALENTTVVPITFEMLQLFYANLGQGEKLGRLIAEDYFFMMNDKIKGLYTQTPLQRYNSMNDSFPMILTRVPQHHIASYLNISPVHLSRLKRGVEY
ncbi:cyclic nucleotide-binding domain-containing protein [Flavobacterium sp. GA093]|uniref:Cyclic nucleotide-binding domain-containing protein n=1 Tax=Flavobacterium hydrocarbonoxydans TaxID=2683249 RepID=A0A6I4NGP5_9FLAO|nr:Crp/Fnr family transcriptional regulator [Flavobacterium hydrocarbonoxydans]MWB93073.1 cyclic nucleotide-binding domain-containing protein [Flavobacterium hydrocarbonoxydans]